MKIINNRTRIQFSVWDWVKLVLFRKLIIAVDIGKDGSEFNVLAKYKKGKLIFNYDIEGVKLL